MIRLSCVYKKLSCVYKKYFVEYRPIDHSNIFECVQIKVCDSAILPELIYLGSEMALPTRSLVFMVIQYTYILRIVGLHEVFSVYLWSNIPCFVC